MLIKKIVMRLIAAIIGIIVMPMVAVIIWASHIAQIIVNVIGDVILYIDTSQSVVGCINRVSATVIMALVPIAEQPPKQ